jgi:hypothetical protein
MTKLRVPLTDADAMTRVAGLIGWAEACRVAGRADRTLRDWSDPSTATTPTLVQARALDAAYITAGGEGAPFRDAYEFQLDLTIDRQEACRHALVADVAAASREFGEAVAAALVITQSNASPLDAHRAVAEVAQAAERVDALHRRLASFLPADAGSSGTKAGGTQG